jgi:cellobiose-specific phosphotransferase system component IIC
MVIGLSGLVIFVLTYRRTKKFIKLIKKQLIRDTVVNINEPLLVTDPLGYMHPIERRLKGFDQRSSF